MNTTDSQSQQPAPQPLPYRQRRILGVLMEKARTTPDAYPLSLNGIVTGCNQKSNRHPTMDLTVEQVEDELEKMRAAGIVAEIQGGSRVAKYRHFGYDYMGVKGAEAAIMTELLLRGEQTAGELRTRASRFEPISDLATLQRLLDGLKARGLVVALTPAGRGQLITHNLYLPEELARLKQLNGTQEALQQRLVAETPSPAAHGIANSHPQPTYSAPAPALQHASPDGSSAGLPPASVTSNSIPVSNADASELYAHIELLREEIEELKQGLERLSDRLERLEN